MTHQQQLEKAKYRQWTKAGLGLVYLKEGLAPFCQDVAKRQHKDILDNIQRSKKLTGNMKCGTCDLRTLKPDHVKAGHKVCPHGQTNCNCCFPNGKIACPKSVCGAVYDCIIQEHASTPPAPNWKNTDTKLWTSDPWSIAKCFINAPGYDKKTSAADTDCTGLLHVIINNKYVHNHVSGTSIFSKVRDHRNKIFHSDSHELEEKTANSYIDDMIDVLQDGKELANQSYAKEAVKKLQELKNKDFIITSESLESREQLLNQIKEDLEQLEKTVSTKEECERLKEKLSNIENLLIQNREEMGKLTESINERFEGMNKRVFDVEKRQSDQDKIIKRPRVEDSPEQKQLEYEKNKADLKDDLIEYYRWRHSKAQLSPLFEENDTPLASFYVRPEINEKAPGKNDEMQQIKSLSAMFKSGGKHNREIYLTADAGLGKTTFSKYLANSWCQAHCPEEKDSTSIEKDDVHCMHEFEFVFLILLRDTSDLCSIDDLIYKMIVPNLAHRNMFDKYFLEEILNHEKHLVILDGLDEWTHPERPCYRTPRSIPHRNNREMCTVLTTTRPWKLGVLKLSSNESGKKVALTKLSNEAAVTLIRRTIQRLKSLPDEESSKNEVDIFIKEINARENAELAFVPLLLMYIICLWCEGVKIGSSKCELYVNIVQLLLSRTADKHGEFQSACDPFPGFIQECFAEHDYCTKYFTLLMKLGNLAYHTLFNEKRENTLVFDRKVAENYLKADDMMTFCLHSGILTGSTTRTLTKESSKVSFSHKTVQEFFAAIFISSQSDAQKTVVEKCKNVQSILDMSTICEFVSKMNSKMMCEISAGLMSVINEDEETREYRTSTDYVIMFMEPLYNIQKMLVSCLQEMTGSENIKLCLQDFFINYRTFHDKHLQRLLKLNTTNMKSLYYGYVHDEDLSLFLSPSLQTLRVFKATWRNYDGNLCEKLDSLKSVQYLNIRNLKLSHEMLEIFYNFICGTKTIKQLTLNRLSCIEHLHDCKMMLNLSKHSQLKYVYLLIINHLDESSLLLSRDMLNIECVELSEIEISGECLQNMVKNMETISHLVTVKMVDIKPETEYERIRNYIRSSQTFDVTQDERLGLFEFQTRKPSKE